MVRKITYFVCEICGQDYDREEEAQECEAVGKPEALFSIGDEVSFAGKTPGVVKRLIFLQPSCLKGDEKPHTLRYDVLVGDRSFLAREESIQPRES